MIGSKLDASPASSRPWLEAAAWLRQQTAQSDPGSQVCGVCTGTFLLAQAGLLDGRVCTTHHRFTHELKRRYPALHVTDNRVYVRDGHVWTSAGVSAGIDLALHLVADAFGDDAAIQVARENVAHFRRFRGDPQLGARMLHRSHGNARVHAVQDAIAKDLSLAAPCEELARRVGWSTRHLTRVFAAETGTTIKGFQTDLRMDLARRLLRESTLSLEGIAERCGFGSVQAFRAHWDQREAHPPSALRPRRSKTA